MSIIVHVDMDAFYASIEERDNKDLVGKALIIGSLPNERGVISTCNYEARKYGLRSAMSIKEAYKLCPHGIYMHPNLKKYSKVSKEIHKIWESYTDKIEYIAMDEAFLDISKSLKLFSSHFNEENEEKLAIKIAKEIKEKTFKETGLKCSVGLGFSMQSAKIASEEKKPDGFFVIKNKESLIDLIKDRDIRVIYGIGKKTALELNSLGIYKVSDIYKNKDLIAFKKGKLGKQIINLSQGIDEREIIPSNESAGKSLGREITFQEDIHDKEYLKEVLILIAKELSIKLKTEEIYAKTISIKLTYSDMTHVSRSITDKATDSSKDIYKSAIGLLENVSIRSVRLIGIRLSGLVSEKFNQLSFEDMLTNKNNDKKDKLDKSLLELQKKFGVDIIKNGRELEASNKLSSNNVKEIKRR